MMQQLQEKTIPGLHEALVRCLPPLDRDGAVLDVGCGTGAWLARLAKHGFVNLYGIDVELPRVGSTGAQIFRMDLDKDDLRFAGVQFQLITAIEVIEHIENVGRLLSLVESHLKDDGLFLLTTPNIHSLHSRLRFLLKGELQFFDEKADRTHLQPFVFTGLRRMLARHGLRICSSWSFPERGGSIASRRSLRLVTRVLGLVVPNPLPGDILCLLVEKCPPGNAVTAGP
jgi:2-polyprenyl-6-hydroxyphenyl methylase/3-demethylubiquinone-9 3-methyltransferase